MRIEQSKFREEIRKKLLEANLDDGTDPLSGLPGIFLLEARNLNEDDWYRCAQFVFAATMKEPWAPTSTNFPDDFWYNSRKFLKNKGYKEIRVPDQLDVVGYRFLAQSERFVHWGYYDQGMVCSKFACFPVYKHNIECVPSHFGDDAVFFRKTNVKS